MHLERTTIHDDAVICPGCLKRDLEAAKRLEVVEVLRVQLRRALRERDEARQLVQDGAEVRLCQRFLS